MNMKELTFDALFQERQYSIAYNELAAYTYPWDTLDHLKEIILRIGPTLPDHLYVERKKNVWIAKSAIISARAEINAPCIICERAEIRQCAYIRGAVIVGNDCVVGNSVELKNCILFDHAQIPHFNYVGDSIIGYHAHMGAGAVTSNIKSDQTAVNIREGSDCFCTGRRKCGAFLGDFAEVGCNTVLNPGTVIGRHTTVYPLSSIRGYVPANCIFKNSNEIVKKH